ncbi:MAG TPA: c-type cytochrome, partial [Bdellovibrionota bacterium]|nr:c-type cytochrome [Bdellovibrionota bacterium]
MADHKDDKHSHHHHILPNSTAVAIGAALLVLTAITVGIAKVDLGRLNFVVAMAVASIKATLVCAFFMNLKYDRRENTAIFVSSFLFLAIFFVLTGTDLFFRGDVYRDMKKPLVAESASKLKDPWVGTPQLISKGKELFAVNCASCHGAEGRGDGLAAAALNPKPRNFHETSGWKNGRKVTEVFKTLKEGIPGSGMASFSTLPADDRWALVHYVVSFGPKPPAPTSADFAKAGVDTAGGGEKQAASIPIETAMARMAIEDRSIPEARAADPGSAADEDAPIGERVYQQSCASCHGADGQGGVVRNLGVQSQVIVRAEPFAKSDAVRSFDAFSQ